ncbi:protein of unassigned function [Methylobacterium oryzae CBMB20]|uniref:Protein of unassigned function n=1 Tax=Methylobacterium oryzae CBMB20 TaxID=693986 RepID=A0A089NR63_9HYPH|nr:protein of unassigned function [Methylobacterium oryzae CBMB20]
MHPPLAAQAARLIPFTGWAMEVRAPDIRASAPQRGAGPRPRTGAEACRAPSAMAGGTRISPPVARPARGQRPARETGARL